MMCNSAVFWQNNSVFVFIFMRSQKERFTGFFRKGQDPKNESGPVQGLFSPGISVCHPAGFREQSSEPPTGSSM